MKDSTAGHAASRRITMGIVAAVALFAAGDSYTHIYHLARQYQPGAAGAVSAALLPLAGDGVIAAASAAMLAAAKAQLPVPARARVFLAGGIAATVMANIAYGLPSGITDALLSIWPVAAYLACLELLAWMRQNLDAPVAVAVSRKPRPHAEPDAQPAPDAPRRHASGRGRKKTEEEIMRLLEAAEQMFPEAAAGAARIPTYRMIQRSLRTGQPNARLVQDHFRMLQDSAARQRMLALSLAAM
jgi:hypothetical protein